MHGRYQFSYWFLQHKIKLDSFQINKHTKHINKHLGANQMNAQEKDNAYTQAVAQANSITAMVAALEVDYDRLEELKDELESACEDQAEGNSFDVWVVNQANDDQAMFHDAAIEYHDLVEAANGNECEDGAREAIQNDALDVQVRSDWHAPGGDNKPSEFQILLCTGGPAVRIIGELDNYSEPCRAWIEYQDWFQPWQEAVGVIEQDVLLTYCQQFYFGE
jgi:hypothetical protein